MVDQIAVHELPAEVRTWIGSEQRRQNLTHKQVLVKALQRAARDRGQGRLFSNESPDPASMQVDVPFQFIDLFAGIGGMRIGMESLGGKCVFTCEADAHCRKTYQTWFGQDQITEDIRDVDPHSVPDHDVLTAGFPCQPFSIAGVSKKQSLGRQHGFQDETQGTLFFFLANIIAVKRPPVILLENVKNLRSHDRGRTWQTIRGRLDALGYEVHDQIIDAAAWVPQHRERIFIVGFDRNVFGQHPPFQFPDTPAQPTPQFQDILDSDVEDKYTLSDKLWQYLVNYAQKHREKGNGFGFGIADRTGVSRTLSARYHKDGSEILIQQADRNPRRLTPIEAQRLMGFPEHLPIVVSDTQAYRQFGNAVVPAVVRAVGAQIMQVLRWQLLRNRPNGCLLKT